MQIRRRAVLMYLIRPLPHVTVWWCVLCRILRGSLCLNFNEESSLFLRSLRANKLVCTTSFLRVFHGTVFGSLPGSLTSSVVFLSAFLHENSCVNLWLKSCCSDVLFYPFQWTASTIFRVRNKLAFQALFHEVTSTFNTHSQKHYFLIWSTDTTTMSSFAKYIC